MNVYGKWLKLICWYILMSVEVERSIGNPPVFWYGGKKMTADEAYDLFVGGTPFEERIHMLEISNVPGQPIGYWYKDVVVTEEVATELYSSGVPMKKRTWLNRVLDS